MTSVDSNGLKSQARWIFAVFALNVVIFGGAFAYEAVAAAGQGQSVLRSTLWMSPILVLAIASLFGLLLTRQVMQGQMLVVANARAVMAIGIGISIAGALQGVLLLYATYAAPDLKSLGGKANLFNLALLSFGGLLQFLALNLQSAAAIKAENDQFL